MAHSIDRVAGQSAIKRFDPVVELDDQVHGYLEIALGQPRLQEILENMCLPPLSCSIRVNRQRCSAEQVMEHLTADSSVMQHTSMPPHVHPDLDNVICIPGKGRQHINFGDPGLREVVVTRKAGEAIIRGAHAFAPGVLAMSKGIQVGDMAAVSIAREMRGKKKGFGLTRGQAILPGSSPAEGPGRDRTALYVGIGEVMMGRREIFKGGTGVAVHLHERAFAIPPFPESLKRSGWAVLQNLPSTVAAASLDARPGMHVLDMCSAPGGKACAVADCMGNEGTILAFDRTEEKASLVRQMAQQYGHGACVRAFRKDSTGILKLSDEVKARHRPGNSSDPETQPTSKQRAASGTMSDREIHRRLRRAAVARMHGHPAPKNNRIPPSASAAATQPGTTQSTATVSEVPQHACPERLDRESFDRVLLDAPCSALGLRPRLLVETRLGELEIAARYQRLMLREAAHVLAVGGFMVFSTCTMNPAENEANVRWFLDRYPQMRLVAQSPRLGGPGLAGEAQVPFSRGGLRTEKWLTAEEAELVQRFDTTVGVDAIAFFIAKFEKLAPVEEDDAMLPIPNILGVEE